MQNIKLISVIVAAYNIEAYLPRCLDSLLMQSYQELEIIVVQETQGFLLQREIISDMWMEMTGLSLKCIRK